MSNLASKIILTVVKLARCPALDEIPVLDDFKFSIRQTVREREQVPTFKLFPTPQEQPLLVDVSSFSPILTKTERPQARTSLDFWAVLKVLKKIAEFWYVGFILTEKH